MEQFKTALTSSTSNNDSLSGSWSLKKNIWMIPTTLISVGALAFTIHKYRRYRKYNRKNGDNILVLNDEEVDRAVSMAVAIEHNRRAFRLLHEEKTETPNRLVMALPEYKGATLIKPSYINDDQHSALGLKVVSVRPNNSQLGLPTVPSTILLLDVQTAQCIALIAGTFLTALRTAAGSGVATDLLCKPSPKTLVVFGAGMQAEQHIHAMLTVRPSISKLYIVNRTIANAHLLAKKFSSSKLNAKGVDLHALDNVKHVVTAADVICTTTNTSTPLFDGSWLNPGGVHLNLIGSYTPSMQEVDVTTISLASQICIDSKKAAETAGDLMIPLEQNIISHTDLIELGKLICETSELNNENKEQQEEQITIFKSVGTAVQDIVTASVAITSARTLGLGRTFIL